MHSKQPQDTKISHAEMRVRSKIETVSPGIDSLYLSYAEYRYISRQNHLGPPIQGLDALLC